MADKTINKYSQEAYDFYFKYATTNMTERSIDNNRSELHEAAVTFALGASWQSNRKPELFIESDCLFTVEGQLYEYSGVVHDQNTVYGRAYHDGDKKEFKFHFSDVETIYWPDNLKP